MIIEILITDKFPEWFKMSYEKMFESVEVKLDEIKFNLSNDDKVSNIVCKRISNFINEFIEDACDELHYIDCMEWFKMVEIKDKELIQYMDDVLELLEEDEDNYEGLIWNLIKIAELRGGLTYEPLDTPAYG